MRSLYEKIGNTLIEQAITTFYHRAFQDPIISHFFFNLNHEDLIQKQVLFTRKLLKGHVSQEQLGKVMSTIHQGRFPINNAHFSRRQVLMGDVLRELGLEENLRKEWLELEESLRHFITMPKGVVK